MWRTWTCRVLQTIDNVKTMSIKLLLLLAYDRRTDRQTERNREGGERVRLKVRPCKGHHKMLLTINEATTQSYASFDCYPHPCCCTDPLPLCVAVWLPNLTGVNCFNSLEG